MTIFILLTSGIIIELLTVFESIIETKKGFKLAIKSLGNKGYKVNYEVSNKFIKEKLEKGKKIRKIILFIPIVNLVYVNIENIKMKYQYLNDKDIKQTLVLMNEEEQTKFKNEDSLLKKVQYATYLEKKEKQPLVNSYKAIPNKKRVRVKNKLQLKL